MQVAILAVGRIKDPALSDLCEGYLRRARRHVPVRLQELRSGDEIPRRLPPGGYLVALTAEGRMLSSEAFARWLDDHMSHRRAPLCFAIGGAAGLPPQVRDMADEQLSLGPMTLPHRLARVVLAEQIYRALAILRGEPYPR